MTRSETAIILKILRLEWPARFDKLSDAEMSDLLTLWTSAFKDDPFERVKAAVEAIIVAGSREFCPNANGASRSPRSNASPFHARSRNEQVTCGGRWLTNGGCASAYSPGTGGSLSTRDRLTCSVTTRLVDEATISRDGSVAPAARTAAAARKMDETLFMATGSRRRTRCGGALPQPGGRRRETRTAHWW